MSAYSDAQMRGLVADKQRLEKEVFRLRAQVAQVEGERDRQYDENVEQIAKRATPEAQVARGCAKPWRTSHAIWSDHRGSEPACLSCSALAEPAPEGQPEPDVVTFKNNRPTSMVIPEGSHLVPEAEWRAEVDKYLAAVLHHATYTNNGWLEEITRSMQRTLAAVEQARRQEGRG